MRLARITLCCVTLLAVIGVTGPTWGQVIDFGADDRHPADCMTVDCDDAEGAGEDLDDHGPGELPTYTYFKHTFEDLGTPAQDLDGLLGKIAASIPGSNVSGETVTVEGALYNSFCLRERSPELKHVGLEFSHSDPEVKLYAKIRKFSEAFAGGSITVYLNDPVVGISIDTTASGGGPGGPGSIDYNYELKNAIIAKNFTVKETADYFIIPKPFDPNPPVMHFVGFFSEDAGITLGEVALEPNTANSTDCDKAIEP